MADPSEDPAAAPPDKPESADPSDAPESPAAAEEPSSPAAAVPGASPPETSPAPPDSVVPGAQPSTPGDAPMSQDTYRASYVFLVVVTLVNLVADLWSKDWAKTHFESIEPGDDRKLEIIPGLMNIIFAKNRGGAWGLLQNETESLRRPFFLVVSVAAIVFIVSLYRKLQPGQTALKWGLPLVLGGALGNLVDRIRYGYVVDFIDVFMHMDGQVKHWPTFNIADVSICVGVGLMAIDMFTSRAEKRKRDGAVPFLGGPLRGADVPEAKQVPVKPVTPLESLAGDPPAAGGSAATGQSKSSAEG